MFHEEAVKLQFDKNLTGATEINGKLCFQLFAFWLAVFFLPDSNFMKYSFDFSTGYINNCTASEWGENQIGENNWNET